MIIKRKQKEKFKKMYYPEKETYEVLAIIMEKKNISYLVQEDNNFAYIVDSKYFDIIDEILPDYWIIKNNFMIKKDYFKKKFKTYLGPKELIYDTDFFFNYYIGNDEADYELYHTLAKYGKEHKSPKQT